MSRMALRDDGWCFACGEKNTAGLKLSFRQIDGRMVSEFVPLKIHQGFQDIVHGGIITTVLDEAMVKTALGLGINAVTAELLVRFKQPLFVGDRSFIEAAIANAGGRLMEASAKMTKADGTVVAEARAKLLRNV